MLARGAEGLALSSRHGMQSSNAVIDCFVLFMAQFMLFCMADPNSMIGLKFHEKNLSGGTISFMEYWSPGPNFLGPKFP